MYVGVVVDVVYRCCLAVAVTRISRLRGAKKRGTQDRFVDVAVVACRRTRHIVKRFTAETLVGRAGGAGAVAVVELWSNVCRLQCLISSAH